jgi:hypothetical protein
VAKVKYWEGDCFGVPLRNGGFALCVAARVSRSGMLVGYFFGPRRDEIPKHGGLAGLRADDAVLLGAVSGLGIRDGKWPVLGRLSDWKRTEWAMPTFIRHEEITERYWRVFYSDSDPVAWLRDELIPPGGSKEGPEDGLMGSGFAEAALTRLLARFDD